MNKKAFIKLATVRLAINYVLRNRLVKSANMNYIPTRQELHEKWMSNMRAITDPVDTSYFATMSPYYEGSDDQKFDDAHNGWMMEHPGSPVEDSPWWPFSNNMLLRRRRLWSTQNPGVPMELCPFTSTPTKPKRIIQSKPNVVTQVQQPVPQPNIGSNDFKLDFNNNNKMNIPSLPVESTPLTINPPTFDGLDEGPIGGGPTIFERKY